MIDSRGPSAESAPAPDVPHWADLTRIVGVLGGADGAELDDAGLITGIDALERVKSACAAAQARLTARFVDAQAAEAARLRDVAAACSGAGDFDGWVAARDRAASLELPPEPSAARPAGAASSDDESAGQDPIGTSGSRRRRQAAMMARTGVSAQVGLARRESPARGARLARASVALVQDLPHTLAALAAGHLTERRAELVVKGTSHLSPELRAIVDAEVVGANVPDDSVVGPTSAGVAGWGDREVERRIRACADRLDPEAATERARRAAKDRRVSCRPIPDCMAVIAAVLPVELAVAIYAALAQAAAAAKAAGDPRSRGQVMADTLYERVTGRATAEDVDVEVQVVITDRALFAGDDTPAHVPGYGSVPAGWVRDLLNRGGPDACRPASAPPASAPPGSAPQGSAPQGSAPPSDAQSGNASSGSAPPTDRASGSAPPGGDESDGPLEPTTNLTRGSSETERTQSVVRAWLRRLYTHPGTGTLVAMDSTRRLFPAGLRRFLVARDGICRTPWCDAPVRHADHVRPYAAGGPTTDTNGQGLCVACNLTKDLPGWYSRVVDPGPTAGSANPHTVEITTPTGHHYTSVAPPVLPGVVEEPTAEESAGEHSTTVQPGEMSATWPPAIELPAVSSIFERQLASRLAA